MNLIPFLLIASWYSWNAQTICYLLVKRTILVEKVWHTFPSYQNISSVADIIQNFCWMEWWSERVGEWEREREGWARKWKRGNWTSNSKKFWKYENTGHVNSFLVVLLLPQTLSFLVQMLSITINQNRFSDKIPETKAKQKENGRKPEEREREKKHFNKRFFILFYHTW